jgi:hydrogenase nickel incorporation protein HypA/HybF
MHELGVATEIHRLCRSRIGEDPSARLERGEVRVGELSALDPDLLRYAWEAVTSGGPDAAAALEIEWRPALQVCEGCGQPAERGRGCWLERCPRCGEPLRVEGGQELDLMRFSYATDDDPGEPAP